MTDRRQSWLENAVVIILVFIVLAMIAILLFPKLLQFLGIVG